MRHMNNARKMPKYEENAFILQTKAGVENARKSLFIRRAQAAKNIVISTLSSCYFIQSGSNYLPTQIVIKIVDNSTPGRLSC